jgi:predicted membrane protein
MNIINDPNESPNPKPGFENFRRRHGSDSRVLLGILFVIIGGILVLNNLDLLPWNLTHILISWPMLLIVIGLYNLNRRESRAGIILVTIGAFFMLPRILDVPDDFYHNFWPLVFVVIGLVFILQWKKSTPTPYNGEVNKNDILDETAIFGGRHMSLVSDQFRGGKITSIFGGSRINLLYCKPVDGCVIDVATIFGGTKIIVPENWNVKTEVVSIFGGFEDKRGNSVISRVDQTKVVVIKGAAIFGGGEITSMP